MPAFTILSHVGRRRDRAGLIIEWIIAFRKLWDLIKDSDPYLLLVIAVIIHRVKLNE